MKSRFKHFIALTVLLANGIASFGQQTTETDTGKTGLEYWHKWLEDWMNPDNQGNNGQGGTSSQGTTSPITPPPLPIEVVEEKTKATCDEFTITWYNRDIAKFYGLDIYEFHGGHINHSDLDPSDWCEWPHCDYSYYNYNYGYNSYEMHWHTFKNLKPDTQYSVYIYGYTLDSNGKKIIVEESEEIWFWTESITLSSPTGNQWGSCGTVKVDAPSDCVVTKWEYDTKVLVPRDGDSFSKKFEVLKYGVGTKVSATIMCPSGKVYTKDITITIKPLNLYCESKVWRCNSVIKMNLENAPASLKTVKWTCSDNLQICYSGFNNTIKYAYFQAKGTGSAWIKASFTYNGITYTKQFSYSIIPKSASYMANKPITDVYTDSTDVLLLSVDELNMESQESSFIVYPNPATTELNIKQTVSSGNLSLEEDGAIKTVDIFDVKGNKCASHVFNDAQTTATIDITDLANGIFVLVINKDSNDAQTCSFVKK